MDTRNVPDVSQSGMDLMSVPQDIRDKAQEIATRHAVSPKPLIYMLDELKLRHEVVEMFAAMADWGYGTARIIAAAQALSGEEIE